MYNAVRLHEAGPRFSKIRKTRRDGNLPVYNEFPHIVKCYPTSPWEFPIPGDKVF